MSKTVNVIVTPKKNESQEKMIRRFTKKVKKEGILEEVRERSYYTKPSQKRRKQKMEKAKTLRRLREKEERRQQRLS
jgi:small subunit ribosomal protein S21